MRAVEEEGGRIAPKLVSRTGHRYRKEEKKGGHGGKRYKNNNVQKDRWLHSLAADAKKETVDLNRVRFMMG